jgi:hypothetical protein
VDTTVKVVSTQIHDKVWICNIVQYYTHLVFNYKFWWNLKHFKLYSCILCCSYHAFYVVHTMHSMLFIPCILCCSYHAFCVVHTMHFVLFMPCILCCSYYQYSVYYELMASTCFEHYLLSSGGAAQTTVGVLRALAATRVGVELVSRHLAANRYNMHAIYQSFVCLFVCLFSVQFMICMLIDSSTSSS